MAPISELCPIHNDTLGTGMSTFTDADHLRLDLRGSSKDARLLLVLNDPVFLEAENRPPQVTNSATRDPASRLYRPRTFVPWSIPIHTQDATDANMHTPDGPPARTPTLVSMPDNGQYGTSSVNDSRFGTNLPTSQINHILTASTHDGNAAGAPKGYHSTTDIVHYHPFSTDEVITLRQLRESDRERGALSAISDRVASISSCTQKSSQIRAVDCRSVDGQDIPEASIT